MFVISYVLEKVTNYVIKVSVFAYYTEGINRGTITALFGYTFIGKPQSNKPKSFRDFKGKKEGNKKKTVYGRWLSFLFLTEVICCDRTSRNNG